MFYLVQLENNSFYCLKFTFITHYSVSNTCIKDRELIDHKNNLATSRWKALSPFVLISQFRKFRRYAYSFVFYIRNNTFEVWVTNWKRVNSLVIWVWKSSSQSSGCYAVNNVVRSTNNKFLLIPFLLLKQ